MKKCKFHGFNMHLVCVGVKHHQTSEGHLTSDH